MKKKWIFITLMILTITTFALAQEGFNFPGYQCQQLLFRDSSRQLTNMTNIVRSVYLVMSTDGFLLNIFFNNGSLPLVFYFYDVQRMSDGSTFFNDVWQADPETMQTVAEGFVGGLKREGSKMFIVVNRGTVNYLNLTIGG